MGPAVGKKGYKAGAMYCDSARMPLGWAKPDAVTMTYINNSHTQDLHAAQHRAGALIIISNRATQ